MTAKTQNRDRGVAWIASEVAAGRQPTNAAVRQQFDVSERTARNWLKAAGNGNGSTPEPATGSGKAAAETPEPAGNRKRRRAAAAETTGKAGKALRVVSSMLTWTGIVVVLAAPVAISAKSLAGWGRESLGLTDGWEWLAPVPLDGAALACVGLALRATLRGDAPGLARVLVWALAGGSAWANYRHGASISPDAAYFFAVQPLLGALLLDLVLRSARRDALGGLGALERPLARYRLARWLVAPKETWEAWRTAVREGITDPAEALQRAAAKPECPSVPAVPARADAGAAAVTRPSEAGS